jgi:ribosomal-protein-alanine N-acetyltransferase
MAFILETKRLCIRQFQDSDLEPFLAYRNDPDVARYQGWDVPFPREKALEFVSEMKAKNSNIQGEWFQTAIEERSSGETVGDTAYFLKRDDPQAYIGCTIARPHWRKGFGIEVTRRLLDYLFGELGLHRVIAITDVENVPSFSMLDRLGFRREGHFVENLMFKGQWASEYHYAMLKREWETL